MSITELQIVQYAQLAMIMEVWATPKPGNVDRDHSYHDTRPEHFIASAIGVFPVMSKASQDAGCIGRYIHDAVLQSSEWQKGGNTHFGAFILLIPLVMAAGKLKDRIDGSPGIFPDLKNTTLELVRKTTVEDAIELYLAFSAAGVRVKKVDDLDLTDPASIENIRRKKMTLFDLMRISSPYDMIAREWVSGFQLTFKCAESILEKSRSMNINDAIVMTFMKILSENPDTFIQTKFDYQKARQISDSAKRIMDLIRDLGFERAREDIRKFDSELIKAGINPGSTADIIISGLFIALVGGLRF